MQQVFYHILRLYVRIGLSFFYRNFGSVKHPNYKDSGSIIFAPTHQNAFMDALAIVMSQKRFSYFLTQAKVFQSKIGAVFFNFIYMMPIYRERDGMHTVKRNKKIIDKCVDVIIDGKHPLTIFPEGNHNLRRSIRPLQKGIARIAFGVLDKNPDTDLKIVPIGINYSAHRKFRSDLFVKYGEPFRVKPFYQTYLKNNNLGYIELLTELDKRMRPLTIDMPRGLKYHQISKEWISNANGTSDLEASFKDNQTLLKAIIDEKDIPQKNVSDTPQWVKVLLFPFGLLMYLNNFIAFKLVRTLTKKLAADPAFESSMDLVFGIFLSFLIYLIQATIISIFTSWNISLVYFLSIPFANFLYFKIYKNSFIVE
jgi:1-acyl-sn-glycerol-3-phosphate acyltransferase